MDIRNYNRFFTKWINFRITNLLQVGKLHLKYYSCVLQTEYVFTRGLLPLLLLFTDPGYHTKRDTVILIYSIFQIINGDKCQLLEELPQRIPPEKTCPGLFATAHILHFTIPKSGLNHSFFSCGAVAYTNCYKVYYNYTAL